MLLKITKKNITLLFIILGFFSSVIYSAAQPGSSSNLVVLKGARIIDGTGSAPIENGILILQGDTIKAIIKNAQFAIPPNAKVINESGKTIIPALIDTHVHLGLVNGTTVSNSNITQQNVMHQLLRYQDYGVGAVLSLGKDLDFIYALRDRRDNKLIAGPYILTAGRGFGVPLGAPPDSDMVYRPTNPQDVQVDMDQLAAHHPNIIKLWLDDWNGTLPEMNSAVYTAIIIDAHKYGFKVAAHVYHLADAKKLVNAGVNILEHSIRDLPVDQDLISNMKKHRVALVPTLDLSDAYFIYKDKPTWMKSEFFQRALDPGVEKMLTSSAYLPRESERQVLALSEKNLKTLFDAGIEIGFGTDAGALPTRIPGFAEHRELELMVNAGLTPMQAIQIATLKSARLLGVDNKMGSLQAGKLANFIILQKNPLLDIRNTRSIDSVWLDGQLVSKGPLATH